MEQGLPMYNGAVPQAAQQRFVGMPSLPKVQGMGEVFDRAVNAGLDIAEKYSRVHDFGEQQRAEHEYRLNELEMQKGLEKGLTARWGTKDSFFNEDGSRNEDNIAAFTGKWQEANERIAKSFWLRDTAMRDNALMSERNDDLAAKVELQTMQAEIGNKRRAFEANYALAVEQGDHTGALFALEGAVQNGHILPAEAQRRKLQLRRKTLKDAAAVGGSVVVNGQEYSGASAGLAVVRAKEGGVEVQGSKAEGQSGGDLTLDEERMAAAGLVNDEGLPLTLQAGRLSEVEAAAAEGQEDEEEIKLQGEGLRTLGKAGEMPVVGQEDGVAARSMTLSEAKLGAVSGGDVAAAREDSVLLPAGDVADLRLREEQRQWTLLPERDVQSFFDAMNDAVRVKDVLREDGGVDLYCESYAPDVVQRVVARANAAGELTAEDAGEMVTVIALDAVHADAGATVDSMLKMFDGAGVYEALGDGDAEVGKVRAAALVRECKERMEAGTNKLGMAAIERMVNARVDEVYRASGRDLARLNPRMKRADGVYESWNARDTDARWHELKHLYLGLRKEFNPGLEDGLSHDEIMDEFDENAQEFYNWYVDGVGKERNAEYKAALKDWYMGQVGMKLADAYAGGGRYADGSGGYAADVTIAREVLKQGVPQVLNADVLAKQREEKQKADENRAAVMRKEAEQQYAKLKGLKEGRSMAKQREEKAKKAAAEKATREEEKRRKAEEKKAQQLEQRKLEVLRARPRRAAWEWDGEQAADGESPACSLPRAEWDALVEELGYDGSTNVYVRLGSRKVLVTGYHEGTGLRLNTPAAMLLQDKKKKVLHVSGELGFSYSFK